MLLHWLEASQKGACQAQNGGKKGIRSSVLNNFESEMLKRSAVKVKDSAAAAQFLHSEQVLRESNAPRGAHLKENTSFILNNL